MSEISAPILTHQFDFIKPAHSNASCTLSGYLVLAPGSSRSLTLWLTGPAREIELQFSPKRTMKLARKYREAPNSKRARIEKVTFDLEDGPWTAELRDAKTGDRWVIEEIGAKHNTALRLFRKVRDHVSAGRHANEKPRLFRKMDSTLSKWEDRFGNDDAQMLEARILLNYAFQRQPSRTLRHMRRLRKIYDGVGEGDRYVAFVRDHLAPLDLEPPTGHGFSGGFQTQDTRKIWNGIAKVIDTLQGMDLPCFINSGTLLGAVRDGDLIGHDDDVDLAVLLPATTVSEVVQAWTAVRRLVDGAGLLDVEASKRHVGILKLHRIEGAQVDLFPAWIDAEGRVFVYPHTAGELSQEDVLPLVEQFRPGIRMPRAPEKMLAVNYGPDWRTPDPLWQFPWATAKKRFAELLDLMERQT